jgi:ornithine cyclodeaminase
MGELHHGLDAGVVTQVSTVIELGEITSGKIPVRQNQDHITICDLTGTGVQDTAIARLALAKALGMGLGTSIDLGYNF